MGGNSIEAHDILIGAVIAIILIVQFAVFFVALKKIKLFKRVVPNEWNFKMVKVYIPESQIRDLSVKGVLENRQRYSDRESGEQVYTELADEITQIDDSLVEDDSLSEENDLGMGYKEELDPETEIWISRENEEKKIQYQLLKSHEASGWTRIQ